MKLKANTLMESETHVKYLKLMDSDSSMKRIRSIEWIDENNVFSSYGVVNFDTFSYQDSDIQPGKQIFVSLKNNDPRRAKIIRVSDNKRQLKEHKDFLERQDQQVKNVLQLCMRTIKEMKSEQYSNSIVNSNLMNTNGSHGGLPLVLTANSDSSLSDSDTEVPQKSRVNKLTKFTSQTHHQNVRYDPASLKRGTQSPALNLRRRSVISSTPLPGKCVPENIKLSFDQGTQTDAVWMQPPISKIEEIELVLKHLHGRFQSLVMRVNTASVTNENSVVSETEQNGEVFDVEPNESWITNNVGENAVGYSAEVNNIPDDVGAEQVIENENHVIDAHVNNNSVKVEPTIRVPNESNRVRRMSAQTTYSNEMVPIGNGRAMVPARLMNDINWSSYTNATRQLLQAIFPRKVLATHSLTGKQSPAHMNKPPKKLLDPGLVEDIIITVSSKCGVAKNLVRNSITVKCTDEAKLYRNRQQYQLSRSQLKHQKQNVENVSPSTSLLAEVSSHFKAL